MGDEIKDSLSDMIKSNDINDIKLAIGIASNEEIGFKDIWYNIKDYIDENTTRYVEMYCKDGGSDKVYLIVESYVKNPKDYGSNYEYGGNYRTIVFYGRRGKSLRKKDYGFHYTGNHLINRLKLEKMYKGYKVIDEYTKNNR